VSIDDAGTTVRPVILSCERLEPAARGREHGRKLILAHFKVGGAGSGARE